ncbi:CerR family C-terminal domain-containing protein [Mesorhizobium sp. CAU 1732]|uniref:CerR family C-terminal domain-containing protein n=1 Tax=Mesorhizobium sp. CAU 1732 TaxID=3140358 RepID=UPI0032605B6C
MPKTRTSSPLQADDTRTALLRAGLHLFGTNGFAATSTREIATAAKANIGSIAYHFGSKEGLRDACAQHIVDTVRTVAAPIIEGLPMPRNSQEARAQIEQALRRMGGFLLAGPEAGDIVPFVLREMQTPTKALDIVYDGVFEPIHKRLCQIWGIAAGREPESEETRIAVFTIIGQIVYFRIGQQAVQRRMGWGTFGAAEAARITETVLANVHAILDAGAETKTGEGNRP